MGGEREAVQDVGGVALQVVDPGPCQAAHEVCAEGRFVVGVVGEEGVDCGGTGVGSGEDVLEHPEEGAAFEDADLEVTQVGAVAKRGDVSLLHG